MTGGLSRAPRRADLDAALRQMLDVLAAEPIPARIMSVIDQLDDGDRQAPALRGRKRP